MITGKAVYEQRKRMKMSQTKLAEQLTIAYGQRIDESLVRMWERGARQAPDDILAVMIRISEKRGRLASKIVDAGLSYQERNAVEAAAVKTYLPHEAIKRAVKTRMGQIQEELDRGNAAVAGENPPISDETEKPEHLPQESEKARTGEFDGSQEGTEMEDTRGKCIVTKKQDQKPSEKTMQMMEPEKKPRFADIQKTMFCMYQMADECEGIDGSTEVLLMAQRELARRMENGVVWE